MANIGITMYFRANRIHIWKGTIRALEFPEYIHLLINEKEKQLFIKGCERDLDAFRLDHLTDKTERCYVNAKTLLRYLARLIDADPEGESYRFVGRLLEDGAVYIDLKEYTIIELADDEDADDGTRMTEVTKKMDDNSCVNEMRATGADQADQPVNRLRMLAGLEIKESRQKSMEGRSGTAYILKNSDRPVELGGSGIKAEGNRKP